MSDNQKKSPTDRIAAAKLKIKNIKNMAVIAAVGAASLFPGNKTQAAQSMTDKVHDLSEVTISAQKTTRASDFSRNDEASFKIRFGEDYYGVYKYSSKDSYFFTIEDANHNRVTSKDVVDAAKTKASLFKARGDQEFDNFTLDILMDTKTQRPLADKDGNLMKVDYNSVDREQGVAVIKNNANKTISFAAAARSMQMAQR